MVGTSQGGGPWSTHPGSGPFVSSRSEMGGFQATLGPQHGPCCPLPLWKGWTPELRSRVPLWLKETCALAFESEKVSSNSLNIDLPPPTASIEESPGVSSQIGGWVTGQWAGAQPSVQFSRSVMYDSLWPRGLQHARPPCPSPTPRACWNSCPLSRW